MSSPDIIMPSQPTYGEGLGDSLKAQMQMLTGRDIGADEGFEELYKAALGREGGTYADVMREIETPLRMQAAQTETDVMRHQLLGAEQKVVKDPETGRFGIPGAKAVTSEELGGGPTQSAGGRYQVVQTQGHGSSGKGMSRKYNYPTYAVLDTQKGVTLDIPDQLGSGTIPLGEYGSQQWRQTAGKKPNEQLVADFFGDLTSKVEASDDDESEVTLDYEWTNPNTGEPLKEGETVRTTDGMLDIFGPTEAGAATVFNPETGEMEQVTRRAGFDPETGEFLGLTTLGADVSEQLARRQRAADIGDVERLGPRATEAYRAQGDIAGALAGVRGLGGAVTDYGRMVSDSPQLEKAYANAQLDSENPFYGLSRADAGEKWFRETAGGSTGKAAELLGVESFAGPTQAGPSAMPGEDIFGGVGMQAYQAPVAPPAAETATGGDVLRDFLSEYRPQAETFGVEPVPGQPAVAGLPAEGVLAEQPAAAAGGARPGYGSEKEILDYVFNRDAGSSGTTALQRADSPQEQYAPPEAGMQAIRVGADAPTAAPTATSAAQPAAASPAGLQALASQMGTGGDFGGIRGTMTSQALEDLALGGRLSDRQLRDAVQQARQASEARGRQFDEAAVIRELQARQQASGREEDRRRAFAGQVLSGEAGMQARELGAAESDLERQMRQAAMQEQYRQAGLGAERGFALQALQAEQATSADPFQSILGRPSGAGAALGQQTMKTGMALGSQAGPQYLNPEAGLGFIQNQAANQASMYGARVGADAAKTAGMWQGLGSLGGSLIGLKKPF